VIGPCTVELARLNAQGSALELSRTGFSYTGEELFGTAAASVEFRP
jgi:hypothetical protein